MNKLYLPSLRGVIGDWVYYPTLMKLKDIAERINIADEIYKSKTLSDMVQRVIKKNEDLRSENISLDKSSVFSTH